MPLRICAICDTRIKFKKSVTENLALRRAEEYMCKDCLGLWSEDIESQWLQFTIDSAIDEFNQEIRAAKHNLPLYAEINGQL